MSETISSAEAHKARGVELKDQGRLDEAIAALEEALRLQPDYPAAYYNIAMIRFAQDRMAEAAAAWQKAIELKPDYYQAHSALGSALRRMGRLHEAVESCRRAVRIKPDDIGSHLNLANALHSSRLFKEAAAEFEFAIKRNPKDARALNNYANLLTDMDQQMKAVKYYRAALRADPRLAETLLNLGSAMTSMGQVDEALQWFRETLERKPDSWEAHSNLLLTTNYHPRSDNGLLAEHADWAKRHAERFYAANPIYPNDRAPDRRLRIGYVSSDFRKHSVAYFFEPILANHDHGQFEIFCYSNVTRPDAVTERMQAGADQWRSIAGVDDERVVQMIREDAIDILVDLSGHTASHRLLVFARKPAPVQVTYLGYPNTTGLATMDYRVGDLDCDPQGMTNAQYTEKLVRLPRGMWCYRPADSAPEPRDMPEAPPNSITFGTFNMLAKLTAETMQLWSRILNAVPNSTLLIKAESLRDSEMRQGMRSSFAEHGADPSCIEVLGREPSFVKHLATYRRVDIALDTFPYNGTTTTCEAMWMGVPTVTLAGRAHLSRVGASLMARAGLGELVAQTPDDFFRIAVELARDHARRREISGMNLRQRMKGSPLMDEIGFTRDLETAYRGIWRKWCETT